MAEILGNPFESPMPPLPAAGGVFKEVGNNFGAVISEKKDVAKSLQAAAVT